MSPNPALQEYRDSITAQRQVRVDKVLRLIGKRNNRVVMLTRLTGWNERTVQRYVQTLIDEGLVCWDTRHMTGARILKLTPAGRTRLSD